MRMLCVWLLLASAGLHAAEIFVSPAGNDTTGDGSIGNPYATLARGQQAATAGDTITFRAGTYTGGGYFTKNNITYQGYTGETAVIELPNNVSGQDVAFYIGTGSNCTIRRLTLRGGYYYALKIDTGPALVEDCIIHNSGRDCVKIPGSHNITIRRCRIYDSGMRDPSNAEGIDNVAGNYMLVQDCYIYNIATNGVYPKGGSIGSIIERCLIRNCGQKGISMAQSSGLQFYNATLNPEYYSCRDCIARNNIIENCEGSGIDLESALRAHVYNNTLINVAKQYQGGIRIASADKGGTVGVVRCRDCTIRNNIIVLGSTSPRPMVFMGNNSHEGTLTMSNNRYFKQGGGSFVFWWEPTSYTLNLANWKTTSGTDTNSTEGDPGVNTTTWHLEAGSACIDAGATIAGFNDDFDGNTRTGAWDIGADESGGTPLTTPPAASTVGTGGGQPPGGSPNGPTGLTATVAGAQVTLGWTDNSANETGFRIERKPLGGAYSTVTTTAANVVTFNDSPGNGTWTYRVIAVNASGDSSPSNESTAVVSSGGGGGGGGGGGKGKSSGGGGCSVNPAVSPFVAVGVLLLLRLRRATF
ncbi:MAG: right-handed parallel beta-helix repeat-containing protein [Planctomycetes bacterium]|nr:right-handed parallel beta-helix repeat-containing protein [Planctomycetota bacterium]MCW8136740.1 right-handed parallel beta-helix repeat-containing protein [Planctomycetota bacterium]